MVFGWERNIKETEIDLEGIENLKRKLRIRKFKIKFNEKLKYYC
jgi:hypothetical protein